MRDTHHLPRRARAGPARCASFPRGAATGPDPSPGPSRGFGRLGLETGAAVLPVAVHGTEKVRRGWKIRPRKVKVRLGRALTFPRTEDPSPALANSVGARIWPVIELQWEWLGGLPPLRKAAVIGAGSWGTAVAVLLARGGLEVQLGTRTSEKAEEMSEARADEEYLPGVQLPDSLTVKRAADIELAGIDLVCLAVPSAALPQAVGAIGDRVGQRTSVLLLSKGMVAPMAALPSEYVSERIRARAVASLGGPAHAKEAVSGTAALVLGSRDADLRDQLGKCLRRGGPRLRAIRGHDRSGGGGRRQERGRPGGRRGPGAGHERGRHRDRSGLAGVRRLRPCSWRPARDLHRHCRGRRPDRDDPRRGQPQPPRG